MSESSKYRNVAKETHFLAQLICDSPGAGGFTCGHLQNFRRANQVLAEVLPSGAATQVVFDYTVPEDSALIVTAAFIRSDADQADFSADNQVLRSDSDPSPAIGPCLQQAQWQANGTNKTPVMPWLALVNTSYILIFKPGQRAQLLVNANITAGQRVELIVCVEGFLIPSQYGAPFNEFQTQFMIENPCTVPVGGCVAAIFDTEVTDHLGLVGRNYGSIGGVLVSEPYGNVLDFWDITDPSNIVSGGITVDFTTFAGSGGVNQLDVRNAGLSLYQFYGVTNYTAAGNCYFATYDVVTVGGMVTAFTQRTEVFLLGVNAPNTDLNQLANIGPVTVGVPTDSTIAVPFGDDLLCLKLDGLGDIVNALTLTVATTPGNRVFGVCTELLDTGAGATLLFASARFDVELQAWTIDDGVTPVLTPLWTTPMTGTEALAVHHSRPGDSIQVIGCVVKDGAQNFVRLFDPATGALLGEYENLSGGVVTDFMLVDTCMFVVTDALANNLHSVDVSDPTTPSLNTTTTVPNSLKYIDSGAFQNGTPFVLGNG